MVSRKRGPQESEIDEAPRETGLLNQIRNMWELANLSQWIYLFGRAVKISEDINMEYLESECLKPDSTVLSEIGLALLKFVSSHRGLTPEIFDEYTRRQYIAKAPHRNPFGNNEEPARFSDFDIFTKIKIIQQLTQWALINPERIRDKMTEQKDTEQVRWRIEKFGWDSQDRIYIVLADNRLYRRTDTKSNPPKTKKGSKKGSSARRASKRVKTACSARNISNAINRADLEDQEVEENNNECEDMKWECIAITLEDYNSFLSTIKKSQNPKEKMLRTRITNDLIPLLEKKLELQQRKKAQKERELLSLEKLACAKRSSRIAGKLEQQKKQEEILTMERKRATELIMAKREQEKWTRLEKERESRMVTREQRLREREARRILHEQELANLSGEKNYLETGQVRLSERHLNAEMQRKKLQLEEISAEDNWIFDCICGSYGQIDDGSHSIACDKCNIWQHSKCVGVSKAEADRHDFSFVCSTCQRRANDKERVKTKPSIMIKLNRSGEPLTRSKIETEDITKKNLSSKNITSSKISPHPSPQDFQALGGTTEHNKDGRLSSVLINPLGLNGKSPQKHNHHNSSPGNLEYRQSSGASLACTGPSDDSRGSSAYVLSPNITQKSPLTLESPPHNSCQLNEKSTGVLDSNTTSCQNHDSGSITIETPNQNKNVQFEGSSHMQHTQIPTLNQENPTYNHQANGTSQPSSSIILGRSSAYFPSPFASAPMLTPTQISVQGENYSALDISKLSDSPALPAIISSPVPKSNTVKNGLFPSESHHVSGLPYDATCVSPIKVSQPRPKASNGDPSEKTPTMLPPVACLTPSPRILNLSPPVKSSEPERSRSATQNISMNFGR